MPDPKRKHSQWPSRRSLASPFLNSPGTAQYTNDPNPRPRLTDFLKGACPYGTNPDGSCKPPPEISEAPGEDVSPFLAEIKRRAAMERQLGIPPAREEYADEPPPAPTRQGGMTFEQMMLRNPHMLDQETKRALLRNLQQSTTRL